MGGEDARSTRRLARRPLRATSWLVLALLLGAALQPASGALAARPVLRPLRAPTPSPATVPVEARDETPPMGWNSWNAFGPDIDAALIEAEARALVTSGLREAGYDTVVVDGGWGLPGRDAHGDLQPDPAKFPEGIAAVAAYVHRLGLRFGIHQAVGMTDCPGRMPGTQSAPGGELQDASTFAAWGVDFIKYDLCHYRFPPGTTPGAPDLAEIAVERGNALIGRYEAASPANLLRGGARIGACPRCPGGHDVTGIGLEGGSLQIDGVTAPSPGPYRLVIRYVNVDHSSAPVFLPLRRRRMALLSVDGGPPIPTWYPVPTTPEGLVTGWGTLGSLDVQVRLRAGTNSLTFSDPGSFEEVIRAAYQRMADARRRRGLLERSPPRTRPRRHHDRARRAGRARRLRLPGGMERPRHAPDRERRHHPRRGPGRVQPLGHPGRAADAGERPAPPDPGDGADHLQPGGHRRRPGPAGRRGHPHPRRARRAGVGTPPGRRFPGGRAARHRRSPRDPGRHRHRTGPAPFPLLHGARPLGSHHRQQHGPDHHHRPRPRRGHVPGLGEPVPAPRPRRQGDRGPRSRRPRPRRLGRRAEAPWRGGRARPRARPGRPLTGRPRAPSAPLRPRR